MTCIIKEPDGEYKFHNYAELYKFMVERSDIFISPYWKAKCEGNDEESIRMRSLLLDVIPDEIVFYKDGWFGPNPLEGDVNG